jgi:hypothetical protein
VPVEEEEEEEEEAERITEFRVTLKPYDSVLHSRLLYVVPL